MSQQESGKSKSSEKSCTSDDLSKPAPVDNVKPSTGMGQFSIDYEDISESFQDASESVEPAEFVDLFQEVNQEFGDDTKVGADVIPFLASLANNVLSKKLEATDEIFKKYSKPANVEFVNTPHINKPVWNSLPHSTKGNDVIL